MMMRIVFFIGVIALGLFTPLWAFLIGSALYIILYGGYEAFFLAVMIDLLFGADGVAYGFLYTLTTGALTLAVLLLRPSMRFNE